MIKNDKGAIDASTEEKIKNAARVVFQQKGYAAARTRDIAEEAGINLALLNYYFRSKEKLFKIIMMETLSDFFRSVTSFLYDKNSSFEQKIELFVINYLDMIMQKPEIPLFILTEVRNHPEFLFETFSLQQILNDSVFVQQFKEKIMTGHFKETNLLNFLINLLSLTVFPVVAQPIFMCFGKLSETQFSQLMQERKKLIPIWIKAMMKNI